MSTFYGLQKYIPYKTVIDFLFYINMAKLRAELVLFSVDKARALHMTSFQLSVLLQTMATSQSLAGIFTLNVKHSFFYELFHIV